MAEELGLPGEPNSIKSAGDMKKRSAVVGTDTYPSITAYRGRKIRAVIPLVAIKKNLARAVPTRGGQEREERRKKGERPGADR